MEKLKKYSAEFVGTLVLVFMGCGSAVVLGCSIDGGHLAVALAFGLAIVAMAYVIGNISGCHINPAVSLAMLLRKKISTVDFFGYIVAQTAGAIAAAGLLSLLLLFGISDQTSALGSNSIAYAGSVGGALFVEVVLTFIFVLVVLGVTSDASKGGVAGIVIGLTLTFVHIVGIPLTGTSVNPARSIGPAIFAGGDALSELWVFIVAPLAGALLAVLVYSLINPKVKAEAKEEARPIAKPKAKPRPRPKAKA
ncbi:MAG: MIP family channel protein [Coriobacteriia bacterium]|nr:MIP family channel protein [Coriobacteriia bacterium]MCL2749586.1 MIP family channel protein [Coriobacteriia bacterium]